MVNRSGYRIVEKEAQTMIPSTEYLVLFTLVWQDLVAVAQLDEDFEHPGEIIFPDVPRVLANSRSVNRDGLTRTGVPFFPGIPGITSPTKVWRGVSTLGGDPARPSILGTASQTSFNWAAALDPTGVYRRELEESYGTSEQTAREVTYAAEQTTRELSDLVSRNVLPELHERMVSFATRVAQIVLDEEPDFGYIQRDDEDENSTWGKSDTDTNLVVGARRQLWPGNNYNANSNANVFGRRGKTKLNEKQQYL